MNLDKKRLITAVSVMIGTCIGAGVLGLPYVAAKAGFFVALAYIVVIGLIILTLNLYMGEISLRTKGKHQIPGYAEIYLGRKGKVLLEFATVFGIYAAIVAYMLGMGESLSFLIFNSSNYSILIGVIVGLLMSILLWRGLRALKKYEKIGVGIILLLLLIIFTIFIKDVNISNLYGFSFASLFLPLGVVLFALTSFHAVPELRQILNKNEKLMKKSLILGTSIPIIFYILFVFVVVGFKGSATPEIATLAMGPIFILLGIFTMFTSYLSLGIALEDNFRFDEKMKRKTAWFFTSIVPIVIFLLISFLKYFSFIKILSIGGVVSTGLIAVLVLQMVKKAKKHGNRTPEYEMPINWFIIGMLTLIFVFGVINELFQII
jgi:tyrosine-specific transport protein